MSYTSKYKISKQPAFIFSNSINYEPLKLVSRLLKNILISPEADSSKGNLILNLSYGRKESVVAAMHASKMSDILFQSLVQLTTRIYLAKTARQFLLFWRCLLHHRFYFRKRWFESAFERGYKISSIDWKDHKSIKKPIRHGRFSGSVSVQLSVSLFYKEVLLFYYLTRLENVVINNTKMFASGIPGSLDMTLRKNGKLERKISGQVMKKVSHSFEDRELFMKLSIQFLESHF